jgi:hypothetical protein
MVINRAINPSNYYIVIYQMNARGGIKIETNYFHTPLRSPCNNRINTTSAIFDSHCKWAFRVPNAFETAEEKAVSSVTMNVMYDSDNNQHARATIT